MPGRSPPFLVPALALVLPLVLLACGEDDDEAGECTPRHEKTVAVSLLREWYLFPELLPADVDVDDYATTAEVVDAMTARARAEGKDRGWSFVTTKEALQRQQMGAAVGFGFQMIQRDARVFLADVFAGSAAAEAGFERGDELVAIGESAATMTPVSQLVAEDRLRDALGPSEAGVTRVFDVMTAGGQVTRTVTKRDFYIEPVPTHTVEPRGAGRSPAGYVQLRTFGVTDAEGRLRTAFAELATAGVTDIVVDVRYNGGGLVSIARQLANQLGAGLIGEPMYTVKHNAEKASTDQTFAFEATDSSIAATRVAFITTRGSASASELVPNVLEPYTPVAVVGARTHGKPVGQQLFEITGCETVVGVVSFKLTNAEGEGDYFEGLPSAGFTGPLCEAVDDLTAAPGDPAEASTATAFQWLDTGSCPAAKPGEATAPDVYPVPTNPSLAQRDLPGLY